MDARPTPPCDPGHTPFPQAFQHRTIRPVDFSSTSSPARRPFLVPQKECGRPGETLSALATNRVDLESPVTSNLSRRMYYGSDRWHFSSPRNLAHCWPAAFLGKLQSGVGKVFVFPQSSGGGYSFTQPDPLPPVPNLHFPGPPSRRGLNRVHLDVKRNALNAGMAPLGIPLPANNWVVSSASGCD